MISIQQTSPEIQQVGDLIAYGIGALFVGLALGWLVKRNQ
jgi:hypothetical protein